MQTVHFGFGDSFCNGKTPSIALNRRGNIVMVHAAGGGQKRYHVGQLNQASVRWSACQPGDSGEWPRVALDNNDVAVEIHWNRSQKKMYCRAARLAGGQLTWPFADPYAEGGNRAWPAVAMNDRGVVVEVHELHISKEEQWLEYGVGQLKESGGQFRVDWPGARFRCGEAATPAIAIDNNGTVVEIHRYPYGNDKRLFYRVGRITGTTIKFEERHLLGQGFHPGVAITDDGVVVVVFRTLRKVEVHQRVGKLSDDGKHITWDRTWYYDEGTVPTVAAAGSMAVEVHENFNNPELRFSTSIITNRASWMTDRLDALGDKPLRDLVLPASHDAGMYRVDLGVPHAKNQNLTIYEQLRYGIRYFDLRPKWMPLLNRFVIHHGGFAGPSLDTVLKDIRQFASDGYRERPPAGYRELVILTLSHFSGVTPRNYDWLVRQMRNMLLPWLVRTKPKNKRLAEIPLNDYVKNGLAILILVDGNFAVNDPQEGFWVYRDWNKADNGDLCVHDRFSNREEFADMRNDQLTKFAAFNGKMQNGQLPCDLFLLSWTLTPRKRDFPIPPPPTPWQLARRSSPHLGSCITVGCPPQPQPRIPNEHGKIMNLLFVDYVESARVTDVALFLNGERPYETREVKQTANSGGRRRTTVKSRS